jgi:two-component system NtrC family response regulator
MIKPKILIVDDDEDIRTQMKWIVGGDYNVSLALDRKEAVERFRQHQPKVVLLDLGLPPNPHDTTEGMATLSTLLTLDRNLKVIIISGQGERDNAVRAIGAGAYDFLNKPLDVEQLRQQLQRCVAVSKWEQDYRQLQVHQCLEKFEGILARSAEMEEVFRTVNKVAKANAPVLILGESGTGKEMIANAIHRRGSSNGGPFVAINCNAIPENLIESELFGYEKGSFTGAHSLRIGLIESAEGGTLFLDEIGDLSPTLQVKMLRFLQEKRIQRIGGREEIPVNTRVIAATHVDLTESIKDGHFREDLFFRLAVVVCKLPPLRARGDDVILLAKDFLTRFGELNRCDHLSFDHQALTAISHYPWPGNVRELQNRIQRAVIMADSSCITCADLELPSSLNHDEIRCSVHAVSDGIRFRGGSLKGARETVERELVNDALIRASGNISVAAKELGISRPTFYELMHKLGVSKI